MKLKKSITAEKSSKEILEKNKKESLYEIIYEKEKEIKELKMKLSKFPFELQDGEIMMTLIISSVDQKIINHSIICKNTEIFNQIENRLYKFFPEFSKTENFFTLNGKKINKYQNLDENNIKNNDMILLNTID